MTELQALIRRLELAQGNGVLVYPAVVPEVLDALTRYTALQAENAELLTQHRTENCEAAGYDCAELGRLRDALTRVEAERDAAVAVSN